MYLIHREWERLLAAFVQCPGPVYLEALVETRRVQGIDAEATGSIVLCAADTAGLIHAGRLLVRRADLFVAPVEGLAGLRTDVERAEQAVRDALAAAGVPVAAGLLATAGLVADLREFLTGHDLWRRGDARLRNAPIVLVDPVSQALGADV